MVRHHEVQVLVRAAEARISDLEARNGFQGQGGSRAEGAELGRRPKKCSITRPLDLVSGATKEESWCPTPIGSHGPLRAQHAAPDITARQTSALSHIALILSTAHAAFQYVALMHSFLFSGGSGGYAAIFAKRELMRPEHAGRWNMWTWNSLGWLSSDRTEKAASSLGVWGGLVALFEGEAGELGRRAWNTRMSAALGAGAAITVLAAASSLAWRAFEA